ncbi:MAG: hypothetical protein US60_C0017G0004 [Microgenomates group bacterium GW2011_GWC1_37_8]|uniref:ArnT-like N-terminal domain-containing protein n=1 Tax=Candidatus Woesebacteria bacterium GW2011_GWB1_38_8 TaxID=1618570 RepID=A0A0G0PA79_9BACT|nr:MAG: hypothetical protein US60_C0017G0004 [Microgenomates group bacterium GW2011_GWC1_37_8]KKQ86201.1 MAG: hypothetical protein UT08_C0001G0067 [Candidatus Woesebacteria bacterium GW2011_GWB1_38_8]
MKKDVFKILFIVIVILGFLLRVIGLNKYPPAVSWDEISHGYNAYSILRTGRDEWGVLFPLSNFRAYGDYPLVLNMYFMIPTIFIMGLNEISIRLPGAILGTLTIVAAYFLVYGLTKSKKISLLTSFLVAFEPWNWFLNRFAAQTNLSIFFLTASAAAFFNREKNKFLLPLSALFLGLTLFSYHTTRIISPLILLAAIYIYRKNMGLYWNKNVWTKRLTLFFILLFFLPLPFVLADPASRARSSEVFLLNEGAVNRIIEKRLTSTYPKLITRLLYNRPVYFIIEATKNHIEYYTPKFLFFKGGTHYQFSLPGKGLLFPVNLLFFYIGIYLTIRKALNKDKNYQFILLWFLLAPLSGSITKEHYAVMRATPMIPLVQLFSAIGVISFLKYIKNKWNMKFVYLVVAIYTAIALLNFEDYSLEYFGTYTRNYSQDRQYGYRQVVSNIKEKYNNYNKIIVTKRYGEPHEFILFFWPWEPKIYRGDTNLIRFYQSNWYWVDRFDKFYFVNDWNIPRGEWEDFILESGGRVRCEKLVDSCLLITSPDNYPLGWTKLETINFLNGKSAFEILEK